MQTYYQKHRSIRAFQFDGTLSQLKRELPGAMVLDLILYINYYVRLLDGLDDDQQHDWDDEFYLAKNKLNQYSLFVDTGWWSVHNYTHRQKHMRMKKYDNSLTVLRPNDYVTIKEWTGKYKYKHLRVYRKADFEAHWSNTPMKQIRKR